MFDGGSAVDFDYDLGFYGHYPKNVVALRPFEIAHYYRELGRMMMVRRAWLI
jgi:hypothetical protein